MNKNTAKGVLTDLLYAYAADEYGDYFYEHGDAVCEAVECIMREQPRWISVEDRLPDNEDTVLCVTKNKRPFVCRYDHYWKHWRVSGSVKVTHWMPLPEPPEVEV